MLVASLLLAVFTLISDLGISPATPTAPDQVSRSALDSLVHSGASTEPWAEKPLTVLAVLSTECPLSRNQVLSLNQLVEQFAGLQVVGIFPRHSLSDTGRLALAAFRQETGAGFQLVGDPYLAWVHRLGATVTPEVFLIDSTGTIVYSGAVDDWMLALGRKRPSPTVHYLRDAILATHAHRKVAVPHVKAVGCLIE